MFQRRVQQYLSRPWSVHRESARARGEINLARDKQSKNRHLDDDSSFFFFFSDYRFATFGEGNKFFCKVIVFIVLDEIEFSRLSFLKFFFLKRKNMVIKIL